MSHVLRISRNTRGVSLCLPDHHRVPIVPYDVEDKYLAHTSLNLYNNVSTLPFTSYLRFNYKVISHECHADFDVALTKHGSEDISLLTT